MITLLIENCDSRQTFFQTNIDNLSFLEDFSVNVVKMRDNLFRGQRLLDSLGQMMQYFKLDSEFKEKGFKH